MITKLFPASALIVAAVLFPGAAANAEGGDRELFNKAYRSYETLAAEGRFEEALPHARDAYSLGQKLFGEEGRNTAALAVNLGKCLRLAGERREAEWVLKDALRLHEQLYTKDGIELVDVLMELGHSSKSGGGYYSRALDVVERKEGRGILYGDLAIEAGVQLMYRGSRDARSYVSAARDAFEAGAGSTDLRTGMAALTLARFDLADGANRRAEELALEAVAIFENAGEAGADLVTSARVFLVYLYEQEGRSDMATPHLLAVGRGSAFTSVDEYKPAYAPAPDYKRTALRKKDEGFVTVEFTVDEQGKVQDAIVVNSTTVPSFEPIAIETVRKYRYAPRFENDQPVAVAAVRSRIDFSRQQRDRCRLQAPRTFDTLDIDFFGRGQKRAFRIPGMCLSEGGPFVIW